MLPSLQHLYDLQSLIFKQIKLAYNLENEERLDDLHTVFNDLKVIRLI